MERLKPGEAQAVLTRLLATGAAFGVARLVFQDGQGAGLLNIESQGSLCVNLILEEHCKLIILKLIG